MAMNQTISHTVILPTPGISHLIPFVEVAKRLVSQHNNFHVTCIIPNNGSPSQPTKVIVEALPTSIDAIFLPPVRFEDLPEGIDPAIQVFLTVSRSLPSLRNVFQSLLSKIHLAAFLTDLFGIDTFDVAKEYNVPSYIFFPSSASALSLLLHIPKLDETVPCEFKDLPEPVIKIPGCILIHAKDLPEPLQERKRGIYEWILRAGKRFSSVDGIAVNSFADLDFRAMKSLQDGAGANNPPVYPIGPLIQTGSTSEENVSECLRWLDNQSPGSVL